MHDCADGYNVLVVKRLQFRPFRQQFRYKISEQGCVGYLLGFFFCFNKHTMVSMLALNHLNHPLPDGRIIHPDFSIIKADPN